MAINNFTPEGTLSIPCARVARRFFPLGLECGVGTKSSGMTANDSSWGEPRRDSEDRPVPD